MFDSFLVFIARHARYIPETLLRGLFLCAADISWLLGVGGTRQLERNVAHVLASDCKPASRHEVRKITRLGMRSYFTYFSEAMTVGARSEEQLQARIRGGGNGLDDLIDYTQGHQGSAPMAIGHQGNWDYAGFWAHHTAAPVTTVAEKLSNERLLQAFVDIRQRLGINILLTGQPGLTAQLAQDLKEPRVLVPLLADRDLSRHGEFVTAFDSIIRVAQGPAALAYDTGLPLFIVNVYREPLTGHRRKLAGTPQGYVCQIEGPVDISDCREMPREKAIHEISQRWVDVWSQGIKRHPQDWHMLQPIFLEDLDLSRLKDVPQDILEKVSHRQDSKVGSGYGKRNRH